MLLTLAPEPHVMLVMVALARPGTAPPNAPEVKLEAAAEQPSSRPSPLSTTAVSCIRFFRSKWPLETVRLLFGSNLRCLFARLRFVSRVSCTTGQQVSRILRAGEGEMENDV